MVTEDDFRALVLRARSAVAEPTARQPLRDAKRDRRATIERYRGALRRLSPRDEAAVAAHSRALSDEAAANRAEARELRELLAALVGVAPGGVSDEHRLPDHARAAAS